MTVRQFFRITKENQKIIDPSFQNFDMTILASALEGLDRSLELILDPS